MNALGDGWRRFRATRGPIRELLTIALCLIIGTLLAPLGVYWVGNRLFGAYTAGGYAALLGDLFKGLATGSVPFWCFAVAPYAAVWLWRIWRWSFRSAQS